jgi:hypothetical protein
MLICLENAKEAVKAALMAEQGFICCYCEQRLSDAEFPYRAFQAAE